MEIQIRQITETDIKGFHKCLDSVAREGKFIAKEKAPDLERIKGFINSNSANNLPQFVAIESNEVVGWCDAIPYQTKSLRHRAELGMGVIKSFRGKGVGEKLLLATINHAGKIGIKRINLEVRSDNENAIGLYKKLGFKEYGKKKMGIFLENKFHDLIVMEYLM